MYDYISVCVTLVSSVCVCLYLLLPLPLSKLRSIRQKFKAYTHTDAPSLTFSHATAKYSTKKRVATTKLCCSFCCHLCNCKQTKASNQNETQPKQGREREVKCQNLQKRIYHTKLKSPPTRCCCPAFTTPLPPPLPSSNLSHSTTTISRP